MVPSSLRQQFSQPSHWIPIEVVNISGIQRADGRFEHVKVTPGTQSVRSQLFLQGNNALLLESPRDLRNLHLDAASGSRLELWDL